MRLILFPLISLNTTQTELLKLNQKLSIVSRVVVHLKYRTIGLGVKPVRETLPLAGTPYVVMVAVMAKYNPFGEKPECRK